MIRATINDLKNHLIADCRIQADDTVFLFSSLKYLPIFKCKPQDILETFESILTEGTLILPTFCFDKEKYFNFNTAEKNCPEMGHIALASIGKDGYKRTTHPMFSVNVFSNSSTSNKNNLWPTSSDAFGQGSIFANLVSDEFNTKIVLLGGPFEDTLYRSTFIHCAQQCGNQWHRYMKHFQPSESNRNYFSAFLRYYSNEEFLEHGTLKRKTPKKNSFPINENFSDYANELYISGELEMFDFGLHRTRVVKAQLAHKTFLKNLAKNPDYCLEI